MGMSALLRARVFMPFDLPCCGVSATIAWPWRRCEARRDRGRSRLSLRRGCANKSGLGVARRGRVLLPYYRLSSRVAKLRAALAALPA